MNKIKEMYDSSDSTEAYVTKYVEHMAAVVAALDTKAVAKITTIIEETAAADKTVFIMGNGGSAAVGTHWVNDLSANTVVDGQPGYRVFSVTDRGCRNQALAPGDTCMVSIEFNPGSNGGAPAYPNLNAVVRVTHNGNPTSVTDFPLKAIHFKQYLKQMEQPEYASPSAR